MPVETPTTGPIHLFARFRHISTINYLGTCVAAPEPEHEKSRIPIMNDIGGRSEPFQIVKDGEHAIVMATMNRFDYGVWSIIKALDSVPPGTAPTAGPGVGQEAFGARGTLTIGVSDFQLILWWQYNGTVSSGTLGTVGGMPPVRQYNSVESVKWRESTAGTRVLEIAAAFKCTSVYNVPSLSFAYSGSGSAGGGAGGAIAISAGIVNTGLSGGLYTENLAQIGTTPSALLAIVQAAGG